ncbi:6495_t:CDS:2 [Dentiscutata heterogama]|uniref:6495_t:CDS:1 n=1 Tax=Dentiscutata heterogama TaxID=1316150 RepID=A0ACA9K009_9GLOM|nr:6495_t:CDS:2 [Dentiscutata heterogama]
MTWTSEFDWKRRQPMTKEIINKLDEWLGILNKNFYDNCYISFDEINGIFIAENIEDEIEKQFSESNNINENSPLPVIERTKMKNKYRSKPYAMSKIIVSRSADSIEIPDDI